MKTKNLENVNPSKPLKYCDEILYEIQGSYADKENSI